MITTDTIVEVAPIGTLRPGQTLHGTTDPADPDYVRDVMVPIAALVTTYAAVTQCARTGRVSESPDEPLDLTVRSDVPGRYEISDGHHRVVAALRAGHTHLRADIWPVPDDEPYTGPFYDFAGLLAASSQRSLSASKA